METMSIDDHTVLNELLDLGKSLNEDILLDPVYARTVLDSLKERRERIDHEDYLGMFEPSPAVPEKYCSVPGRKPLHVLVSGGGPSSLIFVICLSHYFRSNGMDFKITVYEERIVKHNDRYRWLHEGDTKRRNRRRKQVVTVQEDVLKLLPEFIVEELFGDAEPRGGERVWMRSRNIAISEVENRLNYIAQRITQVKFIPMKLDEAQLRKQKEEDPFDCIVGADGRNSFVRNQFSQLFHPVEFGVDEEFALGIAILDSPTYRPQAQNVILILAQTRYLFNSQHGKTGYLNIRLTEEEAAVFLSYKEKGWQALRDEKHPLWTKTIVEGLKLFNLAESSVQSVDSINIKLAGATQYLTELPEEYKNGRNDDPVLGFLIGDAAFAVHFWPGRGMNSAFKGSVALARRIFWSFVGDKDNVQERFRYVNESGALTFRVCVGFSTFMHNLMMDEIATRSDAIVRKCSIENLSERAARYSVLDAKIELLARIKNLSSYQENVDWPHEKIDVDEWVSDIVDNMDKSVLCELAASGQWPVEKMRTTEISPDSLCTNPTTP